MSTAPGRRSIVKKKGAKGGMGKGGYGGKGGKSC